MEEANVQELRAELKRLEAEETRLSTMRSTLHDRIDLGFGTEMTRGREREVSDERRQLHERIASLRELLQANDAV